MAKKSRSVTMGVGKDVEFGGRTAGDLSVTLRARIGFLFLCPWGLLYSVEGMRPAGSPWISRFLYEFHDSPMGSHSGFLRTYKRVAANLFWKGVKRMIRDYVAHEVCQRAKYEARSPPAIFYHRFRKHRRQTDLPLYPFSAEHAICSFEIYPSRSSPFATVNTLFCSLSITI